MSEALEEWRVVSWAPKYKVSNMGRVIGSRGWVLKPIMRNSYHAVNLFPTKDKARMENIHVLVLEEFVGPRPPGYHGCHWDGDKSNNKLSNLRWATVKENIEDQKRHGTFISGERHPSARWSMEDVEKIRSEHIPGVIGHGHAVLARKYGVSRSSMKKLLRGETYRS